MTQEAAVRIWNAFTCGDRGKGVADANALPITLHDKAEIVLSEWAAGKDRDAVAEFLRKWADGMDGKQ